MSRARNRALLRKLHREADRILADREGGPSGPGFSCAVGSDSCRTGGATEAPSLRSVLRGHRARLTPVRRKVLDRMTRVVLEIVWFARC